MSEVVRGVFVRTLGCKVNQVESERVAAELLGRGCGLVAEERATVVVLNTCTVTAEADRKARKAVRHALSAEVRPTVIVTGCLAALDADGLRSISERVVVEADKSRVAERVERALADAGGGLAIGDPAQAAPPAAGARRRTRVQVKVQDGCDAFCAYCIVPFARGNPRSVDLRDVVEEVETLVAAGTAEVVLTGINIGRYRDEGADLAELVRAVAGTGAQRVRLSSVEPRDLRGPLLETLAATPAVCPHLHVPLQSGSDAVLRAMGRGYDTATYESIVAEARGALPGLAVTTDVMAGLPGETSGDAAATLDFVERLGFAKLHVFRYSRRTGTRAASMSGRVSAAEKSVRASALRDLGERLSDEHARSRIGGMASVLVERVSGTVAEGTSEDYLRVMVPAAGVKEGEIAEVRVTSVENGRVHARW